MVMSGLGFGYSLTIHTHYLITKLRLMSVDYSQFLCVPEESAVMFQARVIASFIRTTNT